MAMDSLAENSIERRTLASSTSGGYFLVRPEMGNRRVENLMTGHARPENSRSALSCYPVMPFLIRLGLLTPAVLVFYADPVESTIVTIANACQPLLRFAVGCQ